MHPVLLYGLEACPLNKPQLSSINFAINRPIMQLFQTNYLDIINYLCWEMFALELLSIILIRRTEKFLHNFVSVIYWQYDHQTQGRLSHLVGRGKFPPITPLSSRLSLSSPPFPSFTPLPLPDILILAKGAWGVMQAPPAEPRPQKHFWHIWIPEISWQQFFEQARKFIQSQKPQNCWMLSTVRISSFAYH